MAIIKFMNKKNRDINRLKGVLDYITNPVKTNDDLISGFGVEKDTAHSQMMSVKKLYNKTEGRQFEHFIVSFDDDEITPEKAHEVGRELAEFYSDDYQMLMATHTDKENLHNHYVLNSINLTTGKKYTQNKEQLAEFVKFANEIFKKHNLNQINQDSKHPEDTNYYWAKKQQKSWKYELYLSVVNCMRYSNNKEHFIENMEKLGYKVKWEDNRKDITFTTRKGMRCRSSKLYPPDRFTKEALLGQFKYNSQRCTDYEQNRNMNKVLEALYTFKCLTKATAPNPLPKSAPQSLEGQALEEYLNTHEKGGLWNDLKDERAKDEEWER